MRLVAVVLAVVLSSASADQRALDLLRDWTDAVVRHRAGETDEALSKIGSWTYDDLELMEKFVEALVGAPVGRNEARRRRLAALTAADKTAIREMQIRLGVDADAFRRRAAILHTDAAIRLPLPTIVTPPANRPRGPTLPLAPNQSRQPAGRRVDVLSFDGQYQNVQYSNPHWDLAMDMLDALPASPRDAFVAEWYSAIGAYLVEQRRFSDALVHFDRARGLVTDDARVLYGEARLHETLSAPRMQNFVRVTTLNNSAIISGIDSARTELRRAEGLLQKALGADPALVIARLRLGRVITQQQRWREGLTHLERVLAETKDPLLGYYANLFAGDAQLALGDAGDAHRSYERALTLFPDAQAPRLGMAAALSIGGDREAAVAAVLPTLTKRPEGRADDEPWWMYYDNNHDDASALLDRLRAPFTEPLR